MDSQPAYLADRQAKHRGRSGYFAEVFHPSKNLVMCNFKHFPAPEGDGFDYNPRLITFHPETTQCHSERSEESLLGLEAMRFFVALLLRMTHECWVSGWALIREEIEVRPKSMKSGDAEVELQSSDYDAWAEVEISGILGAVYTIGDNSMLKASVVRKADPVAFAPMLSRNGTSREDQKEESGDVTYRIANRKFRERIRTDDFS